VNNLKKDFMLIAFIWIIYMALSNMDYNDAIAECGEDNQISPVEEPVKTPSEKLMGGRIHEKTIPTVSKVALEDSLP